MNTQEEFKRELKDLLERYQVEINLTTTQTSSWYPEQTITFFAYEIFENGELIHEAIDFEGTFFNGESV